MYTASILVAALSLISVATAAPTPSDCKHPPPYQLKTECPTNNEFDGKYLTSYHAGAGLSNITLDDQPSPYNGYLNETRQQFNFNTSFPWGLVMSPNGDKAFKQSVTINAGNNTTPDFTFGQAGFIWSDKRFGGWLACSTQSSNGVIVKQLFFQLPDSGPFPGCAVVRIDDKRAPEGPPTS